jgi:uncharacterized protein (TIGR02246 family)
MHTTPRSTVSNEIASTRAAFVAALADGDASSACAVYAPEAILVPPVAARLQGRDAIENFWAAGLESGLSRVDLAADEVRGDDGLTYELGRYAIELNPVDGEPIVENGTYLLIHERDAEGRWRRAVEMFSPDGNAITTEGAGTLVPASSSREGTLARVPEFDLMREIPASIEGDRRCD